jgi:L-iditol 2-dehydrogenase
VRKFSHSLGRQRQSNFNGQTSVSRLLAHGRAAALELGAKEVFATAEDFLNEAGKGGCPLVIEATNSPLGFQDACAPRELEAGSSLSAFQTTTPIRFRPRMHAGAAARSSSCGAWADYPRAIDVVTSGRVNVRALVTHRESLNAAPKLFEAMAQNRPGYLKALLYPKGEERDGLK